MRFFHHYISFIGNYINQKQTTDDHCVNELINSYDFTISTTQTLRCLVGIKEII